MSINQKLNELGDIGARGYDPSSEVVTQLMTRARRQRAVRRGSTAFAGSVGAMALALVTVQVVAAVEQNAGFQPGSFPENIPVIEKVIKKPAPAEPVDIKPIIEKLEAAALDKQLAEEEEAAKKAAEEEAAKKAAEEEAPKKEKESTKTTEPKECDPAAKPYDTYVDHYEKCHEGTIYKKAKPGYIDHDGFRKIIQWTDAATGEKYWGAYSDFYNKLVITKSDTDSSWLAWYYPASWISNTCYGATKHFDDGEGGVVTKMESCRYKDTWVIQP